MPRTLHEMDKMPLEHCSCNSANLGEANTSPTVRRSRRWLLLDGWCVFVCVYGRMHHKFVHEMNIFEIIRRRITGKTHEKWSQRLFYRVHRAAAAACRTADGKHRNPSVDDVLGRSQ